MTAIPLLDLSILYERQRDELRAAIDRVLEAQSFILGPEVSAFETEVLAFIDAPDAHAIGVANGSDAIVLALRALEIGPGDDVVCPAYSFTSTGTSISLVGANPVFADIDATSLNLDVASAVAAVTPATRAVIAVHLYGRAADVPALRRALDAAGHAGLPIIEDAAQALGASVDGRAVGCLGDMMTTSFFPSKNLGGFGDGGLVVCHDETLAARVRMLRAHGARTKYCAEWVGQNSRLDALQAAVLRVKLPALRGWCDERRANAQAYREAFAGRGLEAWVQLPADDGDDGRFHHIYNQFNLLVADRDALAEHLSNEGIGTAVYYPRTLPEQPCYTALGYTPESTPISSMAASRSLAVPVYPGLPAGAVERVVDAIARFYQA
jgi:dTDP-4-amino-4,6-dideoxygalactose transaminase